MYSFYVSIRYIAQNPRCIDSIHCKNPKCIVSIHAKNAKCIERIQSCRQISAAGEKLYNYHVSFWVSFENRLQHWRKVRTFISRLEKCLEQFRYMECIESIHVSKQYKVNSQSPNVSFRYIENSKILFVSFDTKCVS